MSETPDAETGEIRFGTTRIAYGVERSSRRRKTVAVTVEPDGSVRVLAPTDTGREQLDALVHRKARWILERRRRQDDLPPSPRRREFTGGESFLYLGRQVRLKLLPRGATPGVRLRGGWLEVAAGPGEIREALVAWYRGHAERRLPERVRALAPAVGVEPAGVLVREPRRRWGSCDAGGVLRFNWRIVQAPRRLVDYVVIHELVHLVHPRHGHDFWAALGRALPDYEARREALRQLGRQLVW